MQKIIGVTELQRHFRPVLEEVVKQKIPVILTRGSRPEAVLISYEEYLHFQELQESEVLARFDQVRRRMSQLNATYDDAEVDADVAAARQELEE